MSTRSLREKSSDGRPGRAAESDPDRGDPHLCQSVDERKIGVRAVPSLRVRERRLGSSAVELQSGTSRPHQREGDAPGTQRQVVGKKNRTEEVAAVRAA